MDEKFSETYWNNHYPNTEHGIADGVHRVADNLEKLVDVVECLEKKLAHIVESIDCVGRQL
jgi:hypothetical protein